VIEKAQRANEERNRLTDALKAAQQSVSWEMTSGCTANRSRGASKDLCDRVDEMRHGIQAADEMLNAERPASSDAMAEQLARVTGLVPATIQRLMPLWMVVAVEVAALAVFTGAFAPTAPTVPAEKPSN
jgi:hypothetical protein